MARRWAPPSFKSAKYLGVTICDLSWNTHISTICRKASNTTAFLRHNLSSCPRKIKATSYTTFVRPQLEYSSSVWDPHTQANIQKLEGVKRRAARFVTWNHNPTDSVTAMIDELGLESLQTRRQRAKLTMMFRISDSHVAISQSPLQHLGPLLEDTSRDTGFLTAGLQSTRNPFSHQPSGCGTHCQTTSHQWTPWRPSNWGSRTTTPRSHKPVSF